jgi:hypothetical protein
MRGSRGVFSKHWSLCAPIGEVATETDAI